MSYPQAFYAISCFKMWFKTLIVKKCDVFMSGPLQAPHAGIKVSGRHPVCPKLSKYVFKPADAAGFRVPLVPVGVVILPVSFGAAPPGIGGVLRLRVTFWLVLSLAHHTGVFCRVKECAHPHIGD